MRLSTLWLYSLLEGKKGASLLEFRDAGFAVEDEFGQNATGERGEFESVPREAGADGDDVELPEDTYLLVKSDRQVEVTWTWQPQS